MSLSMGAFKEVYRGQGIYWAGSYNLDGSGDYRTLGDARAAVDRMHLETAKREQAALDAKVASGAIVCVRSGDNVTVNYPDKPAEVMTIRQFRQRVWDIESAYNLDTVMT